MIVVRVLGGFVALGPARHLGMAMIRWTRRIETLAPFTPLYFHRDDLEEVECDLHAAGFEVLKA
jgi:hypothetical protein